ncbi:MAG TPA: LamG-like jellyroll fold domain-containing protein, partial [Bacteroidota bacterium]|nr:LamG-like jellyroll fold domain-containing protein [Bacteroidota bacterium]
SQYVSVPDNSSLQLTDNLTFEAWVYPTGSGNMAVIDKGNYNYLFEILPNGQTGLGLSSAWGWIYSAGSVPLNTWSHVAVVFQTGTNGVKFYLNGSLLSQHTAPGALTTNTGVFAIGEQAPGNCNCNFFNGKMDEVRVWNIGRSEQQIRADMCQTLTGTETGLVAYWQFNEGSGTVAADSVGGNNGTLTNGPTWATSVVPVGKYGTYDASSSADSAGQSGSNVSATITSQADSLNYLGLYSYGSPTDTAVTSETFPSGVNKRWPVIWGAFEFGTDTANITLSYRSLPGVQNESGLKVLEREEADSPWVDVTGNFAQNVSNHTFSQTAVSSFSQFSIGAGSDNSLPVQMATFTATSDRLTAQLKWTTSTQVDNEGWEIQRAAISVQQSAVSVQQAANSSQLPNQQLTIGNLKWSSVGYVKGAGTSTHPLQYGFVDRGLSAGLYSYRLKQMDRSGAFQYSQEVHVDVGSAPRIFTLSQNYPNPFNPTTTIEFTLEHDGHVTLKVYDILGREVATLLDESRNAGEYQQVVFDGSRFSSGIYFAFLQSGGKQLIKKMLMVK